MIVDGVKIIYGVYDTSIYTDTCVVWTSSQSDYTSDTLNISTPQRIVYAEQDYFLLNGGFIFPASGISYQVGWESGNLSDESGTIEEYIEYQFANTHTSYGIKIVFPEDCVAEEFTIAYYLDSTLIGEESITGNTSTTYSNSSVYENWDIMRITVTKIPPLQRARIVEVYFGTDDTYTEDNLISVEASKKTDIAGDYTDCGEFSFSFFNTRFNVTSLRDLPLSLQSDLSVVIYVLPHGGTEYEVFGRYYSENTTIENSGRIMTVSGYDILYQLNTTNFTTGRVHTEGQSLGAWAEEVAAAAGVAVEVDSSFYDIISYGYITEVSYREAFRLIAEAGNGVLVVDHTKDSDTVKLFPLSFTDTGITFDESDIVEDTLSVVNTDKYYGVEVTKHTFTASSSSAQELGYQESISVTKDLEKIEITYSTYPVDVDSVQLFIDTSTDIEVCDENGNAYTASSGAYTVDTVYSDKIVFWLKLPDDCADDEQETFITLTGKPYNTATSVVNVGNATKNIKTITNNYLLTGDLAQSVANYQYERLVGKSTYSSEVVDETAVDLGDLVDLGGGNVIVTEISFSREYGKHEFSVGGTDE